MLNCFHAIKLKGPKTDVTALDSSRSKVYSFETIYCSFGDSESRPATRSGTDGGVSTAALSRRRVYCHVYMSRCKATGLT